MAGAVESPVLQAEVITLLREIKELLQTRNGRLEEILNSVTHGHSAEPAESAQAQLQPEPTKSGDDSPGIVSPRSSSVSSGLVCDSASKPEKLQSEHHSRRDGMDRIRNYPLVLEHHQNELVLRNPWFRFVYLDQESSISSEPKRPGFLAGSDWSYWRVIGQGSKGIDSDLDDPPLRWVGWGRGRPDYMPEWEMIQVDGKWCHIGGESLSAEIEFSPDEEFIREERWVPYSLAPSWLPKPIVSDSEASHSLSGLMHYRELFRKCLGNLYSVPPDYRICLAFEKDVLHAAVRDGLPLNSTLDRLRQIWEKLYECGGSFEIIDVDDFRQMTWYGWNGWNVLDENPLQDEEEEEGDPRRLSGPALSAEKSKVNIPPVLCVLSKRAGEPAEVRGAYGTNWYRVISFRGLAAILKSETGNGDVDIDQFCNLAFREVEASWDSWFDPAFDAVPIQRFQDILEMHVRCKGRSEGDNPFEAKWAPFHITWFKISPYVHDSNWKSGALYGTTNRSGSASYLQEMAFTMTIFPSRMGGSRGSYHVEPAVKGFLDDPKDLGSWYWSILHLAPPHFRALHQEAYWPVGSYDGHMIPVALILQALEDAADSWEQVANHLSSLIDNQGAIFDPDEHDRLLFDDNTFSRSRLYFWGIDCLAIFIPSISATIREWRNFWEAREHIFNAGENFIREVRRKAGDAGSPWSRDGEYLVNLVPHVEDQVTRLEALKSRLEDMRAQIDTLRNGLFNASAVIESRAATELGENVKLLTYISIVYLPLSFCAALWAIDYSYHPVVFTVVTVLLATTTYLVVMNLNNLARLTILLAGCTSSNGLSNVYLISLEYRNGSTSIPSDPVLVNPGIADKVYNVSHANSAIREVRAGYMGLCLTLSNGARLCSGSAAALASMVKAEGVQGNDTATADPLNLIWIANNFKEKIVFDGLIFIAVVLTFICFILLTTFPGWHEEVDQDGEEREVKPFPSPKVSQAALGTSALGFIFGLVSILWQHINSSAAGTMSESLTYGAVEAHVGTAAMILGWAAVVCLGIVALALLVMIMSIRVLHMLTEDESSV
ncbi:hypothetical protein CNMCM5793_000210 [Aspergillus hiratsukae]|uniref:Uncharacterized protein n=1 Tax=Aspergillus hiratsukae TaxID=1194566 RepID=A0A8H6P9V9_9EURO|nr:hypothetical protein CNMCM5793_000210 [Aspergillus hiratsukae]